MAVTKRTKTIGIVVFAVLAVVAMVVTLALAAQNREPSAEYRPGEVEMPTNPPDPSPSVWPSDWPATPKPKPDDVEPGEGSFIAASNIDATSAENVAKAFAELTISWDTLTDDDPGAGLERAMPFVAEDGDVVSGGAGIGAGWVNAAGHEAYTLPSVSVVDFHAEDEHPGELVFPPTGEPITPMTLEATYKWQGRDGWVSSSSASRTVYLSLVERGGKWLVVEYGFVDPPMDAVAE